MLSFFVISTHLGGAERSLLDFLKTVNLEAGSFIVVTPKASGPLIDEFNTHEIPWVCLPLPQWYLGLSRRNLRQAILLTPVAFIYSFFFMLKLFFFLRKQHIKKIHSTGLKYHLLLGIYCFLFRKIKLYIHLRDIIKNRGIQKTFNLIAKAPNISFACNSKVTAESLPNFKSQIIYNGFQIVNEKSSFKRKDFDIPENKYLVGIVGAIARWKGQREFLLMARKLVDLDCDFHFVIVGDEIYDTSGDHGEMHELKRYTQNFLLYDRVSFLGFQKNTQGLYSLFDVLVHSSIEPEPFGRVILEAMAEGCPVTASGIGGPLEIIEPFENGHLHEPANIQSMVDNVLAIYNSPDDTKKLITKAKKSLDRFSMEQHIQQMKEFLEL